MIVAVAAKQKILKTWNFWSLIVAWNGQELLVFNYKNEKQLYYINTWLIRNENDCIRRLDFFRNKGEFLSSQDIQDLQDALEYVLFRDVVPNSLEDSK